MDRLFKAADVEGLGILGYGMQVRLQQNDLVKPRTPYSYFFSLSLFNSNICFAAVLLAGDTAVA